MERPIFQPIGTPVEELDTPALVVDLDLMDKNIETLHAVFRRSSVKVRPHVSVHQCPQIAHRQLSAGGTVEGISVSTLGEAEVFSNAGFNDVLVASQIVTAPKIRRLCALARANKIAVAVDNAGNVTQLSEAAQTSGVTLGVLVEIDAGLGRCGVSPGAEALELAQAVQGSSGLRFDGLMAIPPVVSPDSGSQGAAQPAGTAAQARDQLQPVVDTRDLIERAGMQVSVVSVGGTHNYDVASELKGITEVQAGSYPLMDYHYCQCRPEFSPAARVLASVVSRPTGQSAVVDAGHKATGPDRGIAVLDGVPGAQAVRFSAEHGVLSLESDPSPHIQRGDKTWLVPYDLGLCFNQYDYVRAVKGGVLEGFWPIAGRGRLD
ncbi:MAG: alanine racemase [Chloroflexi bacterium]|nr:alanine racemase [Chloroflexota bacterium]